MLVVIAALVIAGVLGHLLVSGVVLGDLRTTIRELRSPALARVALYGMLGFWCLVAALVTAAVRTR